MEIIRNFFNGEHENVFNRLYSNIMIPPDTFDIRVNSPFRMNSIKRFMILKKSRVSSRLNGSIKLYSGEFTSCSPPQC